MLSIVIPTIDAAQTLESTLESLDEAGPDREVIVSDGGSADQTKHIAAGAGARVIDAPRGRGFQLALGAREAGGGWLLFVHADTVLERGWYGEAAGFMNDPANREKAAYFRFRLDDDCPAARKLEGRVAWRCRVLGLPYGDQGLLIGRPFFDAVGGYRPIPVMEDVEIARRIGKRRLVMLSAGAVTSAGRYQKGGYVLRPLRNLFCLFLYFIGLPPRLIVRIYG
ncbi:MAG: TIGR04283 family arsenosugar biosynthesis glycosyltransferase [Rhodospirillales bacterium]